MELSIGEAFVNLEHEINTVVGEENVSVPSSPTNVIATSQPGPLSDVPIKKIRHKCSLGQDVGIDEFTSTISFIRTWIDNCGEYILRLANCLQILVDEAKVKIRFILSCSRLKACPQ